MSAHRPKPTLTPERIAWFAEYYRQVGGGWGVFHCPLADDNWSLGGYLGYWPDEMQDHPEDVIEAATWFDTLTASQRRKLGEKAEAIVNGDKEWYCPPRTQVVIFTQHPSTSSDSPSEKPQ